MKIGFCGNTNNYPFVVAQAIRNLGHDVIFIVDSQASLYRPEFKLPHAAAAYGDWIHDCSPVRIRDLIFPTLRNLRMRRLLAGCDGYVLNGYGLSLSAYLDGPSFAILTGGDLDVFANPDSVGALTASGTAAGRGRLVRFGLEPFFRRLVRMQRQGIVSAKAVEYALPGMLPHGDMMLDSIGVPNARRRCFMVTDLETLTVEPLPVNKVLRLFSPARLNWVQPLPQGVSVLDYKGTDEMLHGVAQFRREYDAPFELRLVKKGMHVRQTCSLVEDLGLKQHVTWLEEMSQFELYEEIRAADIILDHFGEGSIGIAARDALAMGRPVIANAKPEIYRQWLGEPIPVVQAHTATEVGIALGALANDRSERESWAARGRQFAQTFFSPVRAANEVLAALRS